MDPTSTSQATQVTQVTRAIVAELSVRAGKFALTASLALEQGVLVLFGRSGSGKSLTIKALAGLIRPTSGHITVAGARWFDSADGTDVPPHLRGVGYVPQDQSLFPFADVVENVTFGLPRAERAADRPRTRALLEALELTELARARVGALSGGERQRVAIARALAAPPRLLLLDEPLSAIDVEGKRELRSMLRATIDRFAIPTVMVTHDPEDALALGDMVVRYQVGRTVASGPPREVLADVIEGASRPRL